MEIKQNNTEPGEINYSDLLEKARNYVNASNFSEAEYYINLSLLSPNLDKNTEINIISLKSYIHFKFKQVIQALNCLSKVLNYINKNKKLNDSDIGFCLAKVLYRVAKLYYPEIRQFNYLSCYFLYNSKMLFENIGITNERKNQEVIEEEFTNILKEIMEEVSLFKYNNYISFYTHLPDLDFQHTFLSFPLYRADLRYSYNNHLTKYALPTTAFLLPDEDGKSHDPLYS